MTRELLFACGHRLCAGISHSRWLRGTNICRLYSASVTRSSSSTMSLSRIVDVVRVASERSAPCRANALSSLFGKRLKRNPALNDAEIIEIKSAMEDINAEDLGLNNSSFPPVSSSMYHDFPSPPISYIHVAENEDLLMAIFVIPPGASIPTHSHPSMFVFSRVLLGEMEIREYDLLPQPEHSGARTLLNAVQHPTTIAVAGDVRALTPSKGNIHSFHANTWTAVFDLLVPPYSPSSSRTCRYFVPEGQHGNISRSEKNSVSSQPVLLKEISCPPDYFTCSIPYNGVPVPVY